MNAAAADPINAGVFIINNVHWLWGDVLSIHQTVSKFANLAKPSPIVAEVNS